MVLKGVRTSPTIARCKSCQIGIPSTWDWDIHIYITSSLLKLEIL